jgi:hypothetical protein
MAGLGIPPAMAQGFFAAVSHGIGEYPRLAEMSDSARTAQGKLLERTFGADAKQIAADATAFLNSLPPKMLNEMNSHFVWHSANALALAANLYRITKGNKR